MGGIEIFTDFVRTLSFWMFQRQNQSNKGDGGRCRHWLGNCCQTCFFIIAVGEAMPLRGKLHYIMIHHIISQNRERAGK